MRENNEGTKALVKSGLTSFEELNKIGREDSDALIAILDRYQEVISLTTPGEQLQGKESRPLMAFSDIVRIAKEDPESFHHELAAESMAGLRAEMKSVAPHFSPAEVLELQVVTSERLEISVHVECFKSLNNNLRAMELPVEEITAAQYVKLASRLPMRLWISIVQNPEGVVDSIGKLSVSVDEFLELLPLRVREYSDIDGKEFDRIILDSTPKNSIPINFIRNGKQMVADEREHVLTGMKELATSLKVPTVEVAKAVLDEELNGVYMRMGNKFEMLHTIVSELSSKGAKWEDILKVHKSVASELKPMEAYQEKLNKAVMVAKKGMDGALSSDDLLKMGIEEDAKSNGAKWVEVIGGKDGDKVHGAADASSKKGGITPEGIKQDKENRHSNHNNGYCH